MNSDDLRENLGLGDHVFYYVPGFYFEGTVTKIDRKHDLVTIEMSDSHGARSYCCGMERVYLILSAAAKAG